LEEKKLIMKKKFAINCRRNLFVHGWCMGFVNYKEGCTRLVAASDKVYQLLAHGRWFSPGTPASSTTKTGRDDSSNYFFFLFKKWID
jgi:hypothetical protein